MAASSFICCSSFLSTSVYGEIVIYHYSIFTHNKWDSEARNIFFFLVMTLSFAFVELIYGLSVGSIGLISDSFHMFFDCAALIIGLVAAIIKTKPATPLYTYGYERADSLAGLINGLLLVGASLALMWEGVERLFNPPQIVQRYMVIISVVGLLMNLLGIFLFHHHHHHHHHQHEIDTQRNCEVRDEVHITLEHTDASRQTNTSRDTLGSLGVMISSYLVTYHGVMWSDPFCCVLISLVTLASTMGLIRDTVHILMQRVPEHRVATTRLALKQIRQLKPCVEVQNANFWSISRNTHVACVNVVSSTPEKTLLEVKQILKNMGFNHISVESSQSHPIDS